MSTDRGTMTRGGSPSPDQQSPWVEPTLPAGRRMPSAPRERKPALLALAILLVALGAGAAGLLVIRVGHRVGAVEIVTSVGQGQQIPLASMREVEISTDSGLAYVPWNQASQVAQFFAANPIPAGTLLTRSMVTGSSNLTNGRVTVGLSLKPGQVPVNLQVGDHVEAFATATGNGCGVTAGTAIAQDGVVTQISGTATQNGSNLSVTVAVDPADAGPLVCNSSSADVGLALAPGNG